MSVAQVNFVKQQGFEDASARTCDVQYPALMFQPRVIGVLVLAAVLLRAPTLFLALSAVLWWSALMPRLNPFDGLYNSLVAAYQVLAAGLTVLFGDVKEMLITCFQPGNRDNADVHHDVDEDRIRSQERAEELAPLMLPHERRIP